MGVWLLAAMLLGCGRGGTSPVDGRIPCAPGSVAVYRVNADGGSLRAAVDTVAPESTFDPSVEVWTVRSWSEGIGGPVLAQRVLRSDDAVGCTFAPDRYGCPDATVAAPDALRDLLVVMMVRGECAGDDARFALIVERDGEPRRLRWWARGHVDDLTVGGPVDTGLRDTGGFILD